MKVRFEPRVFTIDLRGSFYTDYEVVLETDSFNGPIAIGKTPVGSDEITDAVRKLTELVVHELHQHVGLELPEEELLDDDHHQDEEDPL
jgi:hypothetical protein